MLFYSQTWNLAVFSWPLCVHIIFRNMSRNWSGHENCQINAKSLFETCFSESQGPREQAHRETNSVFKVLMYHLLICGNLVTYRIRI